MKRCSYCGGENEDNAVNCADCGTELESTSPQVDPELEDPTLSLVVVGTYRNAVDANMVKTRLEGAGIEACVPEEYTPQILWPAPLELVTVRVAAKDLEAAQRILASEANSDADPDPDPEGI